MTNKIKQFRLRRLSNLEQLYIHIFNILGIGWTRSFLIQTIDETSYNDSLFGISVVLKKYGVECECVKYLDKTEILSVKLPAVIIYNAEFAIVKGCYKERIELFIPDKGDVNIQISEFLTKWSGIILTMKTTSNSGEPNLQEHQSNREKNIYKVNIFTIVTVSFVILSLTRQSATFNVYSLLLILINSIGLGISCLLLQKELHIKNEFTDKLCGMVSVNHGCDEVINSSKSTIFGLVKLSEVGASFFFVNLLTLIFFPTAIPGTAIISVLVLPFSFWSIWYQRYQAKQWCALCLGTLMVMWAQAIVFLFSGIFERLFFLQTNEKNFSIINILQLVLGYIITCLLLNAMMNYIKQHQLNKTYHKKFFNLKYNDKIVKAVKNSSEQFNTDEDLCSSLIFGNTDAQTTITVLSNPYCGPCSQMHALLKNVPGNNVRVQYVLTYFSLEKSIINKYLMAAYLQLGARQTWEIMTEWYDHGKSKGPSFFDKYQLDIEHPKVKKEFEKHSIWREDDRLYGTPTVIINGYELSDPYTVDDYMYL